MTKLFFYIFAMRHLLNCIVNQSEFILKQRIGVVSLNSFCNATGGCRNSEGATLSFIKVNYFIMRHPENNLQQACKVGTTVTATLRHKAQTLPNIQTLLKKYHSTWFSIRVNQRGVFMQFRTQEKHYHYGHGNTLQEAYECLHQRVTSFYHNYQTN